MGSTSSLQLECLFCVVRERLFMEHLLPFTLSNNATEHTGVLPTVPWRFGENLLGVKFVHQSIDSIMQRVEYMYALDSQIEGGGMESDMLQGHVYIVQPATAKHLAHLALNLGEKPVKYSATHRPLVCYLDANASKAKRTLQSLVPAPANNASFYWLFHKDVRDNVHTICRDLSLWQCRTSWWKPLLVTSREKRGLPFARFCPVGVNM